MVFFMYGLDFGQWLFYCEFQFQRGKVTGYHNDLVSKEQFAFIKGRQILDGPFILNEMISWCKSHKQQALMLKIDFLKAYDSVIWDFLNDILARFNFGVKWRSWIKGWFSSLSRMKVNFCKSSFMRVSVPFRDVKTMESVVGCKASKLPVKYLGVKVGENMTRSKAWSDVISKVSIRLSKWKVKTLSGEVIILSRCVFQECALELNRNISVSKKRKQRSSMISFCRAPRSGIEATQWEEIKNIIDSVCLTSMEDRRIWSVNGSGLFSVASTRIMINKLLLSSGGDSTKWCKLLPIKVNIMVWKLSLDRLPTRLNLLSRGINIPTLHCLICEDHLESRDHLVFSYAFVNNVIGSKQKVYLQATFFSLWWHLWAFRNACVFGSPPSAAINFCCRKQGRHEESSSKRDMNQNQMQQQTNLQPASVSTSAGSGTSRPSVSAATNQDGASSSKDGIDNEFMRNLMA
uniref:RNA-directed DNA polymerase, eukaryota n=1 Tax=Tanacetum cinerariifolium TaxID=118510 RepID=A0A6L2M647_TANCI|nr:RNA-directed DNA polymerase, eukaryota [Tanacetum cinerariifolium]